MLNIDLHCHSNVSDGVLAPAEVVARAAANGVDALALTDHDDVAGLLEVEVLVDVLLQARAAGLDDPPGPGRRLAQLKGVETAQRLRSRSALFIIGQCTATRSFPDWMNSMPARGMSASAIANLSSTGRAERVSTATTSAAPCQSTTFEIMLRL